MRGPAAILAALGFLATPALAGDHPLLGKGSTLYKQFCAHCHGLDMVNPGTSSYDLRKFPTDQKERFYSAVNIGKGDMPAWGDILLPDELDAIWVYVATRAGKEPFPEAADAGEAPGDAAAAADLPEDETLRVCLASNGGAMSGRRHDGGSGLDYAVAAEIARRLELDLDVTWFESEPEEENDPVREIYAMLAMSLCDLAPGYALVEGAVGDPPAARAAPPRWDDIPATWELGTQVDLMPVVVSRPYYRGEIGIALRPEFADRKIENFSDLEAMSVGIQQGTLSGTIFQVQAPSAIRARGITTPPGPKFLWEMETGRFDAGLVDVAAFDFHRRQNPVTKLVLSDWRHAIGINIGMAALKKNAGLVGLVDAALGDMLGDGTVASLAEAQKVHYAAPKKPWIEPRLTMLDLMRRR